MKSCKLVLFECRLKEVEAREKKTNGQKEEEIGSCKKKSSFVFRRKSNALNDILIMCTHSQTHTHSNT